MSHQEQDYIVSVYTLYPSLAKVFHLERCQVAAVTWLDFAEKLYVMLFF